MSWESMVVILFPFSSPGICPPAMTICPAVIGWPADTSPAIPPPAIDTEGNACMPAAMDIIEGVNEAAEVAMATDDVGVGDCNAPRAAAWGEGAAPPASKMNLPPYFASAVPACQQKQDVQLSAVQAGECLQHLGPVRPSCTADHRSAGASSLASARESGPVTAGIEEGRVVTPGRPHKGTPFCHKPCYSALFGPELFGYGSNVTSPSRKSNETTSDTNNSYLYDDGAESNGKTCVYKTTNTSPGPIKFQRNYSEINASPNVFPKRHSSGNISGKPSDSNGYHNNNGILGKSGLSVVNESSGKDSGLKLVYQSNQNDGKRPTATVTRSHSDVGLSSLANGPAVRPAKVRGAELFKKVQIYNEYHNNKRGQQLEITENEGNVRVQGALRIYWGLKKPIILQQYDKVPTDPILKKRYSIVTDHRDFKPLQEMKHVENKPDEYNLCIITEQEGDRFLKETDIPLLERLILSPTDSLQQLIDIPEPVLRGLLDKFKRDEEIEVKRLKNKYERIRRRVQQIINDKKANLSRC
ncbi:hypothetical protein MAR_028289 [Mya arenaria]|uniref:SARAH domain-containing protein n=1 Tax=Mya arenaria TaxID=6604 RepID=A0ABY7DGP8_MYAAR|nr:hypothetical protein MAR_028289 [Mya arenaria]